MKKIVKKIIIFKNNILMDEIDIKILLVGDANVGKTSLLFRYIDDNFPDKHMATVGVEYRIKKIEYRGFKIKLQIWDTAGQEKFHSITKNFFRGADGILFIYDITNQHSFDNIKNWIKEADDIDNSLKKILLGNKSDLINIKSVKEEEVENFLKENNLEWYEISAKQDINVKESFNKIIELILKDKSDEQIKEIYGCKLDMSAMTEKNTSKRRVGCC